MSRLHILMDGLHLGYLDGRGRAVRVAYDRDVDPARVVPLSMSMPLEGTRYRGPGVRRWLSALLPDRPTVLLRWRRDFGITDDNPESLLAHIGEDVAGAAQFVREDRLDAVLERKGQLRSLTDDDIAGLALAAKQDSLPYDPDTSTGQFSLAGAQAKFALQKLDSGGWALPSGAEPSTHIFKPAIPGLEDQDVGETLTMRLAAGLGLHTPGTSVTDFAGQRVIGIERFDRWRRPDGSWARIHQEDLGQAAGRDPGVKYESQGGLSAADCGDLLRRFAGGEVDVKEFARAVVFNYLVKGSDAHARNYSLLITPGEVRLAPFYDLNSTLLFGATGEARRLAMSIGGEDRLASVSLGNWKLFAASLRLEEQWVLGEVESMAARLPDVAARICAEPDIGGFAPQAVTRFLDRCTQWSAEAAGHSLGRARRPS